MVIASNLIIASFKFFDVFYIQVSIKIDKMNLTSIKSINEEIQKGVEGDIKKVQTQAYLQLEKEHESNFEETLKIKLDRLKTFIQTLGDEKDNLINSETLEQFQIEDEIYQNVNATVVIQEAQKRIEKMSKTHKLKRNWSICDLKILIWLICKHCQRQSLSLADLKNHRESWEFIASLIPGTNGEACLFKWLSLKRHKITVNNWSEEEEQILIDLQKKYAQSRNKWKYISEQLYTLNKYQNKIYRHPKQCRQHYASFLDENIKKGPWTKEEDLLLLINIIQNNGEKKWCRLVKILARRTQNAIKNRFQLIYAKLKKKKQNKNRSQIELIAQYVKQNGGDIDLIKKQRDSAVKNPSNPSLSPKQSQQKIEEENNPPFQKWNSQVPIIPNFSFLGKSTQSAFVPFVPYHFDIKNITFQGLRDKQQQYLNGKNDPNT